MASKVQWTGKVTEETSAKIKAISQQNPDWKMQDVVESLLEAYEREEFGKGTHEFKREFREIENHTTRINEIFTNVVRSNEFKFNEMEKTFENAKKIAKSNSQHLDEKINILKESISEKTKENQCIIEENHSFLKERKT